MNEPPFKAGDLVAVGDHRLVVQVCWKTGGPSPAWQASGHGKASKSNPHGRYVFSADDAVLIADKEQS